jgi:phosphohistidine phosphatase
MKTLLILRHAKAEKDAPQGDEKRALTKTGERDAASIAQRVKEIAGRPDSIVTSPARRAHQTASIVAEELGFDRPLVTRKSIYAAYVDTLLKVVRDLPDDADRVLIVGHNPGFEELASTLAEPRSPPVELKTAGLAHLELDVPTWADVRPGSARLLAVYSPPK